MRKNLIFLLLAVLLLTPWPVAYAYDNSGAKAEPIRIEAAEPSAAPSWKVFGRAIGGVTTPGALFYIDTTNTTADVSVTLHLTNADELVHIYRYLILKVGVYAQTGTNQWKAATRGNGELIPDTYITIQNGAVSFTLPGSVKYKVTIDRGCFYCSRTSADGGSVTPKFYLAAE